MLLRKLKLQSRESLDERRPALIQALEDIGDFYLELKWDFHSWGRTALCLSDLTVLAFLSCLSIIFKDNFMFFYSKVCFFIDQQYHTGSLFGKKIKCLFFMISVPLVSRILPSDLCKIYKKGSNIRYESICVLSNNLSDFVGFFSQ